MKGKIFNAQEVQNILNGSKVMFREVVKLQPPHDFKTIEKAVQLDNNVFCVSGENYDFYFGVAPYQVGQKIFVKESFDYREHYSIGNYERYTAWKKRPAQHMKQEHSRITFEITDIKVERLKDISEEDCKKWNETHKKPEEKFEVNPFVWVVDFKVNK